MDKIPSYLLIFKAVRGLAHPSVSLSVGRPATIAQGHILAHENREDAVKLENRHSARDDLSKVGR